ncbi:hypothetical protein K3495_g8900 [Podosphaera aphanis]|nr:hypothetical protein K3495_g8900 [Podosphaera aphanis]
MGDHICNGTGQQNPPKSSDIFDRTLHLKSPDGRSNVSKMGVPLPRVDTNLANRSNLQPGPYTPASASPSSASPIYSYFSQALRSVSMPIPRGLPTPEPATKNLDCAFPPFPIVKNSPARTPKKVNTNLQPKPSPPVQIAKNFDNDSFLQRLNGIAPGPFDITAQRENPDDKNTSNRKYSLLTKEFNMSLQRPSTTEKTHSRTSSNGSIGYKSSYSQPPKLPKKSGYDGFGPPNNHETRSRKLPSPEDRSLTFSPPICSSSRNSPNSNTTFSREENAGTNQNPNSLNSSPKSIRRSQTNSNEVINMLTSLLSKSNLETKSDDGDSTSEVQSSKTSDDRNSSSISSLSSVGSPGKISPRLEPSSQINTPSPLPPHIPDHSKLQAKRPVLVRQNTAPNLFPAPLDLATHRGRVPSHSPSQSQSQSQQLRSTSRIKPSKGKCKGCGLEIFGKSVSSADGRLTGRYHKECFVCKACSEPFKTATFYVINDVPYCERHYHKLNGSTCSFCDEGIEGPCFETERKQKLHPGCLSCVDCKCRLQDIYFEMNGRFYCERDADRHARNKRSHGPNMSNRDRMERRTTRLMMV